VSRFVIGDEDRVLFCLVDAQKMIVGGSCAKFIELGVGEYELAGLRGGHR